MYKAAVLGDYDSIYGFAALGLETFPVDNVESARETFNKLVKNEYAIIYITEYFASLLKEETDELKSSIIPSVVPIPGISNNTGIGIKNVKEFVEKAVGSDIIFND